MADRNSDLELESYLYSYLTGMDPRGRERLGGNEVHHQGALSKTCWVKRPRLVLIWRPTRLGNSGHTALTGFYGATKVRLSKTKSL